MVILAMAIIVVGCAPPGPRALLKGRKLLDRGDYSGAVEQLRTATALLATNAEAWNYYGVALEHAGQLADASAAYQNALRFDRDLVEAHYNLGCLYLDENKSADAKTEFTAYILRRSNTPEGWLKLGEVQLRTGDSYQAERSFSTVLSLNQDNAEALNGLGLASVQRGKPHDAAEFFAAAAQNHPDFAPAILNLASVEAEYLHDNNAALDNYRKYLALSPRPAQWDAVNVLVQNMEQMPAAVATAPAPMAASTQRTEESTPSSYAASTESENTHKYTYPKPQQTYHYISNPPPEMVRVEPEQGMVTGGQPATPVETTAPVSNPSSSRGMWHHLNPANWFGSSGDENYTNGGVTPLPAENENPANIAPAPKPKIIPPAPPTFPRYLYLSPHKPRQGDRTAARRAFIKAQDAQQNHDWSAAVSAYQKAAQLDPSWFEAHYNYGVLAYDLGDFSHALAADEMALAIQPGSAAVRYNFALALKSAGYITDAEMELRKVLGEDPDNVKAHLALGNLYAQDLQNPAAARSEYLKVLALDPHNPSATDIQFWLSGNPQ